MKFKAYLEAVEQQAITNLIKSLEAQYPGLYMFVTQNAYSIHIHEIKVLKEIRGQGIGTKAIRAIQDYAKSVNLPITLSPEPEPRMKAKLLAFYKRLGFYNNAGRRKDYSLGSFVGSTWVWRPS